VLTIPVVVIIRTATGMMMRRSLAAMLLLFFFVLFVVVVVFVVIVVVEIDMEGLLVLRVDDKVDGDCATLDAFDPTNFGLSVPPRSLPLQWLGIGIGIGIGMGNR
jgi:hypothetical protein